MKRFLLALLLALTPLVAAAQEARFIRERFALPTACYTYREVIVVDNKFYRCTVVGNPGSWSEVGEVSSLDASKITSGEFNAARIPSLAASKITSGIFNPDRLGSGTRNGTNFLRDDGQWAVANWDGGTVSGATTFDGNVTINSNFLTINAGAAGQPLNINRDVVIGSGKYLSVPLVDATTLNASASSSLGFAGSARWSIGSGAPSGTCANGSIYTRIDSTGGLYLCVNTAWVAQ